MVSPIDSFDDVEQHLDALQARIDELRTDQDRKNDDLDSDISNADEQCAKLDERIDTIEAECRRLADEIATVQRTSSNGNASQANFDSFTQTERKLAASAENSRKLQEEMLSDPVRTLHQGTIERYEKQQATVAERERALVEVSRTVAALSSTDSSDQRKAAATQYRQCEQQLTTARSALQASTSASIEHARSKLAVDKRMRAKHGASIDAGQQAWSQLISKLRTRLDKAITGGHVLPVWFRTALGSSPPPTHTVEWVATATSLLAYRLTYDIRDQLVALGQPPEPATRRRTWHDQLTRDMREHRRGH